MYEPLWSIRILLLETPHGMTSNMYRLRGKYIPRIGAHPYKYVRIDSRYGRSVSVHMNACECGNAVKITASKSRTRLLALPRFELPI